MGLDLNEVHLTRTDGKCGRKEAGVRHHRAVLDEDEVVILNGVARHLGRARSIAETCTIADVEPSLGGCQQSAPPGEVDDAGLTHRPP